jgi:hypothetical protein
MLNKSSEGDMMSQTPLQTKTLLDRRILHLMPFKIQRRSRYHRKLQIDTDAQTDSSTDDHATRQEHNDDIPPQHVTSKNIKPNLNTQYATEKGLVT